MFLELSMKHRMLRKAVRRFALDWVEPVASAMDRKAEFPLGVVKEMASLGYLGLQAPKTLKGAALDGLGAAIVIEEISRSSAALGLLLAVHNGVALYPILRFGTEDQKRLFAPPMAQGQMIGAFCLTEANAGSDAGALLTRAVKYGDGFVLNGSKLFVTNGQVADLAIVLAKTEVTGRPKETSVFVVETRRNGFQKGPPEDLCGMRGNPVCSVRLEQCLVPESNLLGDPGDGIKIALTTLDSGRVGIAAQALGIAQACLDASVRYSTQRFQFGKPIASFQAIQSKIADMAVQVEAARLLTYKAATMTGLFSSNTLCSAMAKLFSSQVAVRSALEAVQIYGGYGYTKAYPVERYLRDAKATEIYEGTSEIQRMVIYRELKDQMRFV